MKKNLLLHSCCGPCSTAVIERLYSDYNITILYYNPNIFPEQEYLKRKNEQIKYLNHLKSDRGIEVNILDCDYESEKFYEAVKGLETEREGGARCPVCFKLRLEKTASLAKEHGFDLFGTTLTVSPHKNSEVILKIGREIEEEQGIKFLAENFKKQNGYALSVQISKEVGLYRQNYCGCEFALKIQRAEHPESLKKVY